MRRALVGRLERDTPGRGRGSGDAHVPHKAAEVVSSSLYFPETIWLALSRESVSTILMKPFQKTGVAILNPSETKNIFLIVSNFPEFRGQTR